MTQRPLYLTDASGARLAALAVSAVGDRFEGTIQADQLPDDLRRLFAEFEEVVEGQMFSFLDQVEDRIRAARLRVVWEDGASTPVSDLQVYPSSGAVSFRATPPAGVPLNGSASPSRPTSPPA
jgi:hypothetical protein